jgi:hypothetical protein
MRSVASSIFAMRRHVALVLTGVIALLAPCTILAGQPMHSRHGKEIQGINNTGGELTYRITAGDARLNRRMMGPVRRDVHGVPAEPVDSFVWNGEGSTPIKGSLIMEVQPMTNTGFVYAEWTDRNGRWTYKQIRFLHPDHHPSGVRIGSSVNWVDAVLNEGISHNVYLHGDTASGQPILPTVFNYVTTWGPAAVTLNGEPFDNPFEIPAPLWSGHLMVTEGVRRPDGTVRTMTGEIFNPSHAAEGAVEPGDLEVHFTFHDDIFPRTSSMPPIYSFFYHLLFEEVRIEIVQSDAPERLLWTAPKASPPF